MSHTVSAHAQFKSRYTRNLEVCLGAGILFHLLVVMLFPPLQVAPFRLPPPPGIIVIDLEPIHEFDFPKPPPDIPRPPTPDMMGQINSISEIFPVLAPEVPMNPFPEPTGPGTAGKSTVSRASTQEPKILKRAVPVYPSLAREAGAEGTVLVEVVIDPTGRVINARVVKSDTVPSLKRAALDAAYQFLFAPARQHHRAISVRLVIPFHFRLNQQP